MRETLSDVFVEHDFDLTWEQAAHELTTTVRAKANAARPTRCPEVAAKLEKDKLFSITAQGVWEHCISHGWSQPHKRCRPPLNDDNKASRVAWAHKYNGHGFIKWVDVDEKWFSAINLRGTLKVPRES